MLLVVRGRRCWWRWDTERDRWRAAGLLARSGSLERQQCRWLVERGSREGERSEGGAGSVWTESGVLETRTGAVGAALWGAVLGG